MAVDTQAKRISAIGLLRPWYPVAVPPTGAITQEDRQATAWMYVGVEAAAGLYGEPRLHSIAIARPDFAIAADRHSITISVSRPSFTIVVHQRLE